MFFLVYGIIGNILSLKLINSYLIFLEVKWRRIILAVSVEHGINWMMFQCSWAKRNLHAARDIRIILNWLQKKMMFCTVFPTLLWFLAHKFNIIYLHSLTANKQAYFSLSSFLTLYLCLSTWTLFSFSFSALFTVIFVFKV